MGDELNWKALEDIYPEQLARDPMEWRFLIYGKIADHDDACFVEFLARNSRAILDILKAHQAAATAEPPTDGARGEGEG